MPLRCLAAGSLPVQVPPVFMFQAKVFNPSRLCAIYKRKDAPSP